MHAIIVVALTLLIIWRLVGGPWLRHFAFPVCFIFVAVPWVTPIEAPIVQGLMRVVAGIAAETIRLFGIPAQLEGSVIRISDGVVGVNEACSGVRSLQTSLMIGLLFGELKRLTVWRRIALVAAAAGIAFVANCARTLFLVWIATQRGVSAVDRWHDTAGYAILGAVFLGTVGVATLLARKAGSAEGEAEIGSQEATVSEKSATRLLPSDLRSLSFVVLVLLLAIEVTVEAWYRVHERNFVATPAWTVRWPESVAGFRELPINDHVREMLRFDNGRQAIWPLRSEPRRPFLRRRAPATRARCSSFDGSRTRQISCAHVPIGPTFACRQLDGARLPTTACAGTPWMGARDAFPAFYLYPPA